MPAIKVRIDKDSAGQRLDKFLAGEAGGLSRAAIQRAIKSGAVTVNGKIVPPSKLLRRDDEVIFEPPAEPDTRFLPEDIPLDVLYEDDDLIVVNKPAGLVVHPWGGRKGGTLVNALLYHSSELSSLNAPDRPGIIHRLDADTSGVIIAARNDRSHLAVAGQFENRTVEKTYIALVEGEVRFDSDLIDLPLGRHFKEGRRQAVRIGDGKPAQSAYRVLERFGRYTFLEIRPRTGRTHQIRVHLATRGMPVLCDATYGRRRKITASELLGRAAKPGESPVLTRQALHARSIRLAHPTTGREIFFEAPIPPDIAAALDVLRGGVL